MIYSIPVSHYTIVNLPQLGSGDYRLSIQRYEEHTGKFKTLVVRFFEGTRADHAHQCQQNLKRFFAKYQRYQGVNP